MNSMNDQHFFDLAMRVIARQATDAECAELETMLAQQPELKAEVDRLRSDACLVKEVLPLMAATATPAREFPRYARERLQTKVRPTFGGPQLSQQGSKKKLLWGSGWRLWVAVAGATALIVLLLVPGTREPRQPTIQVAMLDVVGSTRGTDTGEAALLQRQWQGTPIQIFSKPGELETWEKSWPNRDKQPAVKIIYDRAKGEIRVSGRHNGMPFQKTFLVGQDLTAALNQAKAFVREQTGR